MARHEIVIVGANSNVGRKLGDALSKRGVQPLGLVRRDPGILPIPVIDNWMARPEVLGAVAEASIIFHLAGTIFPGRQNSFQKANVAPAQRLARLVREGGNADEQRIVYVSCAGADPHDSNKYLRTKGKAEQLLNAEAETVVLRSGPIISAPHDVPPNGTEEAMIASSPGKAVPVFGDGAQPLRAVYSEDVTKALICAMDGPAGTYDLVGPDALTADDLVRVLNPGIEPKINHVPTLISRLIGLVAPGLTPTFVDLLLRGVDGDPRPLEAAFGMSLTSLRQVWTVS